MNFFLRDVWKQSKALFVFFMLFILGTIWCTYAKMEITPFFLWAHYSEREVPTGEFDRIYIKVNGELLDLPKLSRPTREMIQLPTEYFVQLEERSYPEGYSIYLENLPYITSTEYVLQKHFKSRFSASDYSKLEKRLVNSHGDRDAYLRWLARYIKRIYAIEVKELEVGSCDLVFQEDRSVVRENEQKAAKLTLK